MKLESSGPPPGRRRPPAARPRSRHRRTAACASARRSATATWRPTGGSASATRCWPRRCCAGASGQMRNMATIGGNLLQRTRCALLPGLLDALQQARPGRRLPARSAATHEQPPSSAPATALRRHPPVGHGRRAGRAGGQGGRHAAGGTASSPSRSAPPARREPHRETVLEPGELITAVVLPPPRRGPLGVPQGARPRVVRVRLVSAAAAARPRGDGTSARCRWPSGGGGRTSPWRAFAAEGAGRRNRRPPPASARPPTPSWPQAAAAGPATRYKVALRPQPHRRHPGRRLSAVNRFEGTRQGRPGTARYAYEYQPRLAAGVRVRRSRRRSPAGWSGGRRRAAQAHARRPRRADLHDPPPSWARRRTTPSWPCCRPRDQLPRPAGRRGGRRHAGERARRRGAGAGRLRPPGRMTSAARGPPGLYTPDKVNPDFPA